MRSVLVTGAAGRIGSDFVRHAGDRYTMRLAAHHVEKLSDTGSHQVIPLELADPESCLRACRGIDTVVHLGGNPSPKAHFLEQLLDSNIKGVYNILRAAKDEGCSRVIVASSVQAVAGYPLDVQSRPEDAVRPVNMYGVCKCFAEAAAHHFAYGEDLPCVVVRIGHYESQWFLGHPHARNLSAFVSRRDMAQLLVQCIETPDVRFAIASGVSNNRFKIMDLRSTRELFGYHPVDDAFQLAGVDMQHSRRWVDQDPTEKGEE